MEIIITIAIIVIAVCTVPHKEQFRHSEPPEAVAVHPLGAAEASRAGAVAVTQDNGSEKILAN